MRTTGDAPRWSDAFLDGMREQGDPPADRVIADLMAHHEVGEARRLLRSLVENDAPVPDQLPSSILTYLAATDTVEQSQDEAIGEGQVLFAEYGPVILLCLASYSLPAAYAAAKGVKVLHRTAYLEARPAKRLFETTQMVIDVMRPGGLGPGGRGVRTAQKVRLMHAMVRYMILHDPKQAWPAELGVPINQEDLAGTLMTFSWIVLDGLAKLGIEPPVVAQESYLAAWRSVGRLMGVQEALLPRNVADAGALTRRIQARQIAPCEEGRMMTRALLDMMERNVPGPLCKGMPAAMIRHFLPPDVSDGLGVPVHHLESLAFEVVANLTGEASRLMQGEPALARAAYHFGCNHLQGFVNFGLEGRSAPFDIPAELHRRWTGGPAREPNLWERLFICLLRPWYALFGRRRSS